MTARRVVRVSCTVSLVIALVAGCGGVVVPPATSPAGASASGSAAATPSPSPSPSLSPSPSPSPDQPSPTTSETQSAAPTRATPSPVVTLPETPIEAVLDEAYDTSGADFDPANLGGLQPGAVTARWFVDGERWVVHYQGLDLSATGPLCPGNSILTAFGFEHVSNAPTATGVCGLFQSTLAEPPVGVRLCDDQVLYVTEIPADAEGRLFATIERSRAGGAVTGLTGEADLAAGRPPVIDLDALGCDPLIEA